MCRRGLKCPSPTHNNQHFSRNRQRPSSHPTQLISRLDSIYRTTMQATQQDTSQSQRQRTQLVELSESTNRTASAIFHISENNTIDQTKQTIGQSRQGVIKTVRDFLASTETSASANNPTGSSLPFTVDGRGLHLALGTLSSRVIQPRVYRGQMPTRRGEELARI